MYKIVPQSPVKSSPKDRDELYYKQFERAVIECRGTRGTCKAAYWGVRFANMTYRKEFPKTLDESQAWFNLANSVLTVIGLLTPRALMRAFPIEKTYDGVRYESKDYFSTIKAVHAHGIDKPLGDEAFNLLCDYMNPTIHMFVVNLICVMSDIRRGDGEQGLIEEFFGVKPYSMQTDAATNKTYLVDPENGAVYPVAKKKPRHIKLVQ